MNCIMPSKIGITIAGSIILDIVKSISEYPKIGMMSYITDTSYAVGGCVPNTAIDLKKIDPEMQVEVIGKMGNDENSRLILSKLKENGIRTDKISFCNDVPTSFCDVMSIPTGERTFFHQKGANTYFAPSDIDVDSLHDGIFHIGYLLLLDEFEKSDSEHGTVLARLLHTIQQKGIKTSIDMVSDGNTNYAKKIVPVLKHCNYMIVNEVECCEIWKLDAQNQDGTPNRKNIIQAMQNAIDAGVRDKVIVHCKDAAFLMNTDKKVIEVPSLRIPKEDIKGSVGAGDAFCAGCLYGLYQNYTDREILEFASAAAACNLFAANSIDGMRSKTEILQIAEKYGRLSK